MWTHNIKINYFTKAPAANVGIHKKNCILWFVNKNIDNSKLILKQLTMIKDSDLLIKGVTQSFKNKT